MQGACHCRYVKDNGRLGVAGTIIVSCQTVSTMPGGICWFMHCDELFKLQCSDIAFGTESMTINITSSKTDQYRKGSTLVIARTGTPTYLVAMMERYFSMGGL